MKDKLNERRRQRSVTNIRFSLDTIYITLLEALSSTFTELEPNFCEEPAMRIVILVEDNYCGFATFLPNSKISDVASALNLTFPANTNAGKMTTNIIQAIGPGIELISSLFWVNKANYDYLIKIRSDYIRVIHDGLLEFSGKLADFHVWALQDCVGKTVQFTYDGGTDPGETRTVVLQAIKRTKNGHFTLNGVDASKMVFDKKGAGLVLKDGWRQYSSDKINGLIRVVS